MCSASDKKEGKSDHTHKPRPQDFLLKLHYFSTLKDIFDIVSIHSVFPTHRLYLGGLPRYINGRPIIFGYTFLFLLLLWKKNLNKSILLWILKKKKLSLSFSWKMSPERKAPSICCEQWAAEKQCFQLAAADSLSVNHLQNSVSKHLSLTECLDL